MSECKTVLFVCALLTVVACKNSMDKQIVAARLTGPTTESRAELLQVVTRALNTASVNLADNALMQSNVLVVERRRHQDLQGNRIQGRELGEADRFRLLLDGNVCVLEHQNSARRWVLREANCIAANSHDD